MLNMSWSGWRIETRKKLALSTKGWNRYSSGKEGRRLGSLRMTTLLTLAARFGGDAFFFRIVMGSSLSSTAILCSGIVASSAFN